MMMGWINIATNLQHICDGDTIFYQDSDMNLILTHWGLAMPYGVGDLGQHWFR